MMGLTSKYKTIMKQLLEYLLDGYLWALEPIFNAKKMLQKHQIYEKWQALEEKRKLSFLKFSKKSSN